jgi:hypothetical protein
MPEGEGLVYIKRHRGGQKGNQNARKHGFYSDVLDKDQKQHLKEAGDLKGINEEIKLLRLKLRTVIERDPENIRLISQAATTLARLVRTRHHIGDDEKDDLAQTVRKCINDFAEQGIYPVYRERR